MGSVTYTVWKISRHGPTVDNKNLCICTKYYDCYSVGYLKRRRVSGAARRAIVLPIVAAPLQPSYSQVSQKEVTSLGPLDELGHVVLKSS